MSVRLELEKINIATYEKLRLSLTFLSKKVYGDYRQQTEVKCYLENLEDGSLDPYFYIPRAFYIMNTGDYGIDEKPIQQFIFRGNLRPEQIPVADSLIQTIITEKTVILEAPTGFGKTIFGIHTLSILSRKTIIVTPISETVEQWVIGLKTHIKGIKDRNIWIIGGTQNEIVPDINDIWIIVCYIERAVKVPQSFVEQIGFMIIDEIHACCTPTLMRPILRFNPEYILGETATLIRDDGLHRVAQAIVGNSVTVKVEIFFRFIIFWLHDIKVETPINVNGKPNYQGMINNLVGNEKYIDTVVEFVRINKKQKMLLLCDRRETCKILCERIKELDIDCDFMFGNKEGGFKNSQIIVATEKTLGTGFDEGATKGWNGQRINCVARIGGGKCISRFKQNLGRAVRSSDPMFVLFNVDNAILNKHTEEIASEVCNNTRNRIEAYGGIVDLETQPRNYIT